MSDYGSFSVVSSLKRGKTGPLRSIATDTDLLIDFTCVDVSILASYTPSLKCHKNDWLYYYALIFFPSTGEEQLDAPDSPMVEEDGHHTDPGILDGDDNTDTVSNERDFAVPRTPTVAHVASGSGCKVMERKGEKPKQSSSSSASGTSSNCSFRPTLPPIYHTVKKLKQSKLVVRHLNGGGTGKLDCTTPGASNSNAGRVGSFINENDKRHNFTVHRHDHATCRNISFSFNPETLVCNTCSGEHRVLRRSVEGGGRWDGQSPVVRPDGPELPCHGAGGG